MVQVYLSDECKAFVHDNYPPRTGEHLGSWLAILWEAYQWRDPQFTNQVTLEISSAALLSLGGVIKHLKVNSPSSELTSLILSQIKEQEPQSIVVEFPPPIEDGELVGFMVFDNNTGLHFEPFDEEE